MPDLKGTQTAKNLMAAFAGESQARNRYTYYASAAKKEGLVQIANIFEETANQEREHAKRLFKLMQDPRFAELMKDPRVQQLAVRAFRLRGRVQGAVDQHVQQVAGKLGLATQKDLRALHRRIRHLEQELVELYLFEIGAERGRARREKPTAARRG